MVISDYIAFFRREREYVCVPPLFSLLFNNKRIIVNYLFHNNYSHILINNNTQDISKQNKVLRLFSFNSNLSKNVLKYLQCAFKDTCEGVIPVKRSLSRNNVKCDIHHWRNKIQRTNRFHLVLNVKCQYLSMLQDDAFEARSIFDVIDRVTSIARLNALQFLNGNFLSNVEQPRPYETLHTHTHTVISSKFILAFYISLKCIVYPFKTENGLTFQILMWRRILC